MPNTVAYSCTMTIWKKCPWVFGRNLLNGFLTGNNRYNNRCCQSTYSKNAVLQSSLPANSVTTTRNHIPVLVDKVVEFLKPEKCQLLIDMTFGNGGHTRKLLEHSKSVKILCLDRDRLAYDQAKQLQAEYPDQIIPIRGKFSQLPPFMAELGYGCNSVDGILFDLGTSSTQFDDATRGFAFFKDGPLDMRMEGDDSEGVTAADVLAHASETDLRRIFKIYGEEPNTAKKIAQHIVEARTSFGPLCTTNELREIITLAFENDNRLSRSARLTRIFSSLRLFVNNELNEIDHAIVLAHKYLKIGGVMVTLSLNKLEDTIVKNHITGNLDQCVETILPLKFYNFNKIYDAESLLNLKKTVWKQLHKHVIVPDRSEVNINPRSKSAKLRASIKIA